MRRNREQAYRAEAGVVYPRLHKRLCIFFVLLVGLCMATLMPQVAYGAPNDVMLTIEQNFDKPTNSVPDDTFTYELKAKAPGNPMPVGTPIPPTPVDLPIYTTTVSGNGSAGMGPITYTATGTYSYEIKVDSAAAKTGYTYDPEVYTVTVYVTSSASGLVAQMTIEKRSGEKSNEIAFNQSYRPKSTVQVDPPVKKQVMGDSPSTNATFTFKLEATEKSNPMPEGSSGGVKYMDIVGAGERDFGTFHYTMAGIYHYTVSEVKKNERGYTYDTEVYTITDTVTDVGGQLVNSRVVTNSASKPAGRFLFINTYTAGAATLGPKTGDGSLAGLYTFFVAAGGTLAVACVAYLARGRKAGRAGRTPTKRRHVSGAPDKGQQPAQRARQLAKAPTGVHTRLSKVPKRTLTSAVLVVAVVVVVFAGVKLAEIHQTNQAASQNYAELSDAVLQDKDASASSLGIPKREIDFAALKAVNADAVAWLYAPDTPIDYPVMAADDYNWYLYHLPDGTYNTNGTLFLDYNHAPDFSGTLNIIYGHSMDSGAMFGSLAGYKSQDYYDEHSSLYLYTENSNYRIDLMYGFVVGAGEWRDRAFMYEQNLGSLLSYAAYNTTFVSNVTPSEGDRFVVLSTCSYEFGDARYAVIGIVRAEVGK